MKNVSTEDIVVIVQKYSDFINRICHKYFIVGGTNEDLYQEGVIGLLQACKNFNSDSLFDEKFEPFAKLCIKRQIFDAIKKSNAKKNKALNESVSIVNLMKDNEQKSKLEVWFDRTTSNDPLDLLLDREKFDERISLCENQLSKFEREVLTHYLDGEKQSEIAKKLGKDVKSIDNTIQRIKTKLK